LDIADFTKFVMTFQFSVRLDNFLDCFCEDILVFMHAFPFLLGAGIHALHLYCAHVHSCYHSEL